MSQDTHFRLESRGRTLSLDEPAVMGILNVTPDSFYDGGKYADPGKALAHAEKMIAEGAAIIDIGAVSTRPGSADPGEEEELKRLMAVLPSLRKKFPDVFISVDTFRSSVAGKAIAEGADIINDISGGTMDENMFPFIAKKNIPYVLMHIRGTPDNMQHSPVYEDVVKEVKEFLVSRALQLKKAGASQLILDPGFGFGKTVEHNFTLLSKLEQLASLGFPLLAGFSRKSMITKFSGTGKNEALNATTVLNTMALNKGARILRVHDVKEATEAIRITSYLRGLC
ncbi:MAG TPA: dihydropteroate synthase [Bacteroidia bacterium]|nr:dihydropteroate synthase [Bacteroidia bacterium]